MKILMSVGILIYPILLSVLFILYLMIMLIVSDLSIPNIIVSFLGICGLFLILNLLFLTVDSTIPDLLKIWR